MALNERDGRALHALRKRFADLPLTACDRDAFDHTAKASLWPNGVTAGPSYGCRYRRSAGAPAIIFAME